MAIKLQPVRGTHDFIDKDYDQYKNLVDTVESIVRRYSYTGFITPIFETTSVFTKTLGDTSDIVGKEMYTFDDKGGESLTLRPEGTAAVIRGLISNGLTQSLPFKAFYHGPMFRYERPQAGRTRQFHQFGIECIGVDAPFIDVEILCTAFEIFKAFGMLDKITLELNTLGDKDSRTAYKNALVDYFSTYKTDLSEDSKRRLETNPLRILDSKDAKDRDISKDAPQLHDYLNTESKTYFEHVCEGLQALNLPFQINQRLVRGLDYYNHTAFEFTTSHLGAQGTVLAGGRYNGLVSQMGGPDLAGIGWAFGIERMLTLAEQDMPASAFFSIVSLESTFDQHAFILAQQLRSAGFSIDIVYTGNAGKRMKRADKIGSKAVILLAGDEMAKGSYLVRSLKDGSQELIPHDNLLNVLKALT